MQTFDMSLSVDHTCSSVVSILNILCILVFTVSKPFNSRAVLDNQFVMSVPELFQANSTIVTENRPLSLPSTPLSIKNLPYNRRPDRYILTGFMEKSPSSNASRSSTSQKFPVFYGQYITVIKIARQLSLSCAKAIQSASPPVILFAEDTF
jgi:hypothetical protein